MASERKTSGWLVLFGWAVLIFMGGFLLAFGQDWYANGRLRMCVPEDIIGPPDGRYAPPKTMSDLDKPEYWCALQVDRAAQARGEQPPLVSPDFKGDREANRSRVNNCLQQERNGLISDETCLTDKESFNGLAEFWGDDLISNFFSNLTALIARWLSEMMDQLFHYELAPAWNSYFAANSPAGAAHRKALSYVAGAIFLAILGGTVSLTIMWLNERSIERKTKH